jgi:endonuclease/exonuclease/phosphatase family metal-dependent hydrolase
MIRLASFNIYWFGEHPRPGAAPHIDRDDIDLDLLAHIIADLDADVIAFQEIHDRGRLQAVLDRASVLRGTRTWTTEVPLGALSNASASLVSPFQVVVAVDTQRVEVQSITTPIPGVPSSRRPLVVRVCTPALTLELIAVHMKSGLLGPDHDNRDNNDTAIRTEECKQIYDWLHANPGPARAMIGDFNAFQGHSSLQALEALEGWTWPQHHWPAGARRWTTHLDSFEFDPCAIDHLGLSAGLVADALHVHCFDQDQRPARDGQSWRDWLATDTNDETHLRRLSDHRPIYSDVRPVK